MRVPPEPIFISRRSPVLATHGMAACSQPLASHVGLRVLQAGGNAADAAVAMAAALNVTEPCSTGIGGDCFALYYEAASGRVTALNGSGRAPAALSLDLLDQRAQKGQRPWYAKHANAATVPGACAGWFDFIDRHGSMPMAAILNPAIQLAEEGFPVSPITSHHWAADSDCLRSNPGGRELLVDGRAPGPGEVFRNPTLARTFRAVAEGGPDAFYRGEIARKIVDVVQAHGGLMTMDDLAAHRSTWDEPISVVYRGAHIWECPPNGQGLAALLGLGIMEGLDVPPPLTVDRVHLQIEAMRLAFADSSWHVADPAFAPAPLAELLSADYAAERRALIDPRTAMERAPAGSLVRRAIGRAEGRVPAVGDTVYFCVVDGRGNACSFINSNYMGFGTGLVPEGCGFSLQNRGFNFSLSPSHPNALAGAKRPYHTIIPGLATQADGSLLCPFGVMGGFMQPQGHLQVVMSLLDDGVDPQTALDQPRFCLSDRGVAVEEGLPAAELAARRHPIEVVTGHGRSLFGRGQIIVRQPDGVLWAGSDMRADGCAMGW